MRHFHRSQLASKRLQGRVLQWAVGQGEVYAESSNMSVGFAHYSSELEPMAPHEHAEETIYVIDTRGSCVEWGPGQNQMNERVELTAGMLLHVAAKEWHVFRCEEGGFLDILVVYAPPI